MDDQRKFPPALMLTQMRQKVSRSGSPYLEGRLGLSKVLLLRSNKVDDEGNPIWNLCVQEMPRDDAPRPAAPRSGIFAPAEPKASPSPKRKEPAESEPYPFNDNIDDLWPSGRA
jgi:hypothetical protein